MTSFTVFVACIGRPSLATTVQSFVAQTDLRPTDRLRLVMNPAEGDVAFAQSVIATVPNAAICLCDRAAYFGKMNWAVAHVPIETTHILPMIGDDDIFSPDAFATLRPVCDADPTRVILAQFVTRWRATLWDQPRMQISKISGQSIVLPSAYWGIPFGTRDYLEVDYDWMTQVLVRASYARGLDDPLWLDQVICVDGGAVYA